MKNLKLQKSNSQTMRQKLKKNELKKCNVFLITVPTPIDQFKAPDLTPLLKASSINDSAQSKFCPVCIPV